MYVIDSPADLCHEVYPLRLRELKVLCCHPLEELPPGQVLHHQDQLARGLEGRDESSDMRAGKKKQKWGFLLVTCFDFEGKMFAVPATHHSSYETMWISSKALSFTSLFRHLLEREFEIFLFPVSALFIMPT